MKRNKWNRSILLITMMLLTFMLAACGPEYQEQVEEERPDSTDEPTELVELIPKENVSSIALEDAFRQRRSSRLFADCPVELEKVGKLVLAVQGEGTDVTSGATRPVASAGATHPLEIFVVAGDVEDVTAGVYQYDIPTESLIQVVEGDIRKKLAQASLGQGVIADAPVTVVIAADKQRTTQRYGERGIRYVYMESGGAAQHVALQAAVFDLGSVIIGAFEDEKVRRLMQMKESPLLLIPVGYPAE